MFLVLIMMLLQLMIYIRHSKVFNGKKWYTINNMFEFIRQIFFTGITFFSCNTLKCVSMNKQECKIIPKIIYINSNESLFYPYSILVNKCSGSCNNINNPHGKYAFLRLLKT